MKTQRIILLVGLALVIVSSTSLALSLYKQKPKAPSIQGTLLMEGRPLADFSLLNHHGEVVNRDDLMGQWHIVTYGYTYCPDMCPMALSTLGKVVNRIQQNTDYDNLRVLFYSVDPERDTPAQLADYAPKIHPEFIGLTRHENEPLAQNSFEQNLGMAARLQQPENPEQPLSYNVSHGVQLYLLNPEAELQAVFDSTINSYNLYTFDTDTLFRDYVAVREFFAHPTN